MTNTKQKTFNLSAYFMLPLLKLSTKSFNEDNLENVYITTQMQVVVVVKNKEEVSYDYTQDINYVLDYDEDDLTTIVYQLGEEWGDDFLYYTKGLYSRMTMFAKDQIKEHSGLVYRKKVGMVDAYDKDGNKTGKQVMLETDNKLRALDLDPVLKSYLEKELDIRIPEGAELLDKIKDTEFIKL